MLEQAIPMMRRLQATAFQKTTDVDAFTTISASVGMAGGGRIGCSFPKLVLPQWLSQRVSLVLLLCLTIPLDLAL